MRQTRMTRDSRGGLTDLTRPKNRLNKSTHWQTLARSVSRNLTRTPGSPATPASIGEAIAEMALRDLGAQVTFGRLGRPATE